MWFYGRTHGQCHNPKTWHNPKTSRIKLLFESQIFNVFSDFLTEVYLSLWQKLVSYLLLLICGKQCSQLFLLFTVSCDTSRGIVILFLVFSSCSLNARNMSEIEWDTKSQVNQRQQLTALNKKIPLNTNWIAKC